VFTQIKPWLVSVFSDGLKTWGGGGREDLEDGQTAGRSQLLEIREQLSLFVNWWLETAEWRPEEDSWRQEKTKTCAKSFRTVSRVSWLVKFGQPPYSPDLAPTDFHHSLKQNPPQKISGHQWHREPNRWIKCSAFGRLRLLFCGILEGRNKSVAVEQVSFYFLCVCLCVCLCLSVRIDWIPEGNFLTTYCSQIHFCSASFVLLLQVACVTAVGDTATYMSKYIQIKHQACGQVQW